MRYSRLLLMSILPVLSIFAFQESGEAFSINISPPSVNVTVQPGETKSDNITVENKSDSPMDMRVYTEDWVYNPDGSKKFMPAGTSPTSCAKWITTRPQKLHLEPGGRMGVQYTISVPPDAEGGHYAVIFFESIVNEAEAAKGNVMVRFAGRIGTIIYQETGGRIKRMGSIASFSCGRPDQNGPLKIKLTLKNEGNTHIIAQGVMNIIDKDGNAFGKKELGPINTLSGDTIEYETEWLGDLSEGSYDAIATLDTGLDTPLVAETVITVAASGGIDKLDINTDTNPPSFSVLVNNTGNLNSKTEGKLDIVNEKGEVAETVLLKKTLVAPNSQKAIEAKAETVLPAGKYKARAAILFGGKELTKEGDFLIK